MTRPPLPDTRHCQGFPPFCEGGGAPAPSHFAPVSTICSDAQNCESVTSPSGSLRGKRRGRSKPLVRKCAVSHTRESREKMRRFALSRFAGTRPHLTTDLASGMTHPAPLGMCLDSDTSPAHTLRPITSCPSTIQHVPSTGAPTLPSDMTHTVKGTRSPLGSEIPCRRIKARRRPTRVGCDVLETPLTPGADQVRHTREGSITCFVCGQVCVGTCQSECSRVLICAPCAPFDPLAET